MTESKLIKQWAKSAKLLFESYGFVDDFTECLDDRMPSDLRSIMWKKSKFFCI